MERNIFELATRQNLTFETNRGIINVCQLWDLPLVSNNQFNLDNVARAINHTLKSVSEESFVKPIDNPEKNKLELKLDVVKHIIAVKIQEQADREAAAKRQAERSKLLALLDKKKDAEMEALTPEEIEKRLKELGV